MSMNHDALLEYYSTPGVFTSVGEFASEIDALPDDIATLAGIEAAEAILSGNRQSFDEHLDPTTIGIRSVGKPLEFRNPPGVEI